MALPKISAIYGIRCLVTNASYIGCTGNVRKRWREHRCTLRNGKHCTKPLQNEWDAHGEDNFVWEILETIPSAVAEKRRKEQEWFGKHDGPLLCNPYASFGGTPDSIAKAIEASRTSTGRRWTPEANMKRSLAQKGIPKGHGAKISATKRAKRQMQELMI